MRLIRVKNTACVYRRTLFESIKTMLDRRKKLYKCYRRSSRRKGKHFS